MKYSVIIPVYNAEKTLRKCVDSVLAQGYSNAEIILVNDGSKDSSGEICEEYSQQYQNILYISQSNAGVSAARNAGLDAAHGEYVLFVDSDDYVVQNYFSAIDDTVGDVCSDLIQFSVCVDNGAEKKMLIQKPTMSRSREELLPHIIKAICNKTINAPHAKLYKRKIIEEQGIRFPTGVSVAEDRAFNIVYSFYIHSYAVTDVMMYVINIENEDSLSRRRHADLNRQFRIAGEYMSNKLNDAGIPDKEKQYYHQALNFGTCRAVYHEAKLMIQDRECWFTRQKYLIHRCREINGKHMKYPNDWYCRRITLPVRMYLTPVIDAMAMALTRCK